jgi:hypothetical protein
MLEIVRLRMGVGAPCNSFKFLHLPGNKAWRIMYKINLTILSKKKRSIWQRCILWSLKQLELDDDLGFKLVFSKEKMIV